MIKIERPPHVETRRAKAIVDAEGQKLFRICATCRTEKYILVGQTICDDCRKPRGKPFIL